MMAGGALINALAFSGTNAAFSLCSEITVKPRENGTTSPWSSWAKHREEYSQGTSTKARLPEQNDKPTKTRPANLRRSRNRHAGVSQGDGSTASTVKKWAQVKWLLQPLESNGRTQRLPLFLEEWLSLGSWRISLVNTMKVFELRAYLKERGVRGFIQRWKRLN